MSLFITLEGPEGSGKTTQAKQLAGYLRAQGFDVLLSREPGGPSISEQIRQVLTSLDNTAMHPRTEFLLFSASRAQHVQEVIRLILPVGDWLSVTDSTMPRSPTKAMAMAWT